MRRIVRALVTLLSVAALAACIPGGGVEGQPFLIATPSPALFNFPDGSQDQDQVTFTVINLGHANTGQMVFPFQANDAPIVNQALINNDCGDLGHGDSCTVTLVLEGREPNGPGDGNNATFTVSGAQGGEVTVPIVIV